MRLETFPEGFKVAFKLCLHHLGLRIGGVPGEFTCRGLGFQHVDMPACQPCKECQPGVGEHALVVSGGYQIDFPALADLVAEVPHPLAYHVEAPHRQAEVGKAVVGVGVGAAVADDDLRLEFARYGFHDLAEDAVVGIVARVGRQRDIHRVAPALARADVLGEARPGVERARVLVQVYEKHARLFVEILTGAVSGMCIGVQYHHAFQFVRFQQVPGGEGDVVVQAKAFARGGLGVVHAAAYGDGFFIFAFLYQVAARFGLPYDEPGGLLKPARLFERHVVHALVKAELHVVDHPFVGLLVVIAREVYVVLAADEKQVVVGGG